MTKKHPWELVSSPTYFRRVLGNFVQLGFGPVKDGQAKARFGETGIGHSPHYQITDNTDASTCFNGQNHKPEKTVANAFADINLSERSFSCSEVQALLAGCATP